MTVPVRRNKENTDTGQALVEFALSIPLVLVVLMGLTGMAFLLFSWVTLYHAANEGVSYTLHNPIDTKKNAVKQVEEIVDESVTPAMFSLYADGTVSCTEQSNTEWLCTYSNAPDTTVLVSQVDRLVAITIEYRVPLPTVSIPVILGNERITVMTPVPIEATSAGYYS